MQRLGRRPVARWRPRLTQFPQHEIAVYRVLGLDQPKRREQRQRFAGGVAVAIQFGDDLLLVLDVPLVLDHRFLDNWSGEPIPSLFHRSCPARDCLRF